MRLRQAVLHPMLILKSIKTGTKSVDRAAQADADDMDIKTMITRFATGSAFEGQVARDLQKMLDSHGGASDEMMECPLCFEVGIGIDDELTTSSKQRAP